MFVIKSKHPFVLPDVEILEYKSLGDVAEVCLYNPETREMTEEYLSPSDLLVCLPEKVNTEKVREGLVVVESSLLKAGHLELKVTALSVHSFIKLMMTQCEHVSWKPNNHDCIPTFLIVWRLIIAAMLLYVTYLFHC